MKSIIFSTPMVQAILDGRKTQTRRVINPRYKKDEYGFRVVSNKASGDRWIEKHDEDERSFDPPRYVLPTYQPGDVLWVRETWGAFADDTGHTYLYYKANDDDMGKPEYHGKWRPSIHMPREVARIFLRLKSVRVERVQEITLDDMDREGLYCDPPYTRDHFAYPNGMRRHWIMLWDSTNAKRGYGWDTNPWVWVYEFERINKEDAK